MTFSQLSLEYFFQKKADGKILSGSTFVFKHSQGVPLIRVVSTKTQTWTEIADHLCLASPCFFPQSPSLYQKYYLKPALLLSALWMQKHIERKYKLTLLDEVDWQIQGTLRSNLDWPSPSEAVRWVDHEPTFLLLCQPSYASSKPRSSLEAKDHH